MHSLLSWCARSVLLLPKLLILPDRCMRSWDVREQNKGEKRRRAKKQPDWSAACVSAGASPGAQVWRCATTEHSRQYPLPARVQSSTLDSRLRAWPWSCTDYPPRATRKLAGPNQSEDKARARVAVEGCTPTNCPAIYPCAPHYGKQDVPTMLN